MTAQMLAVARAEALFLAPVSATSTLSRAEATAAIAATLRSCGGLQGCVGVVAAEFGEHPDTAVPRMRWALSTVDALFGSGGVS